jgi:hypothetical protein
MRNVVRFHIGTWMFNFVGWIILGSEFIWGPHTLWPIAFFTPAVICSGLALYYTHKERQSYVSK